MKFKEYLTEVQASKRVGIQHLHQLKPVEFINLLKYIEEEYSGKLSPKNISIREKIDGAAIRFGLDENNKFFLESSRSGPKFKPGSFLEYINQFNLDSNIKSEAEFWGKSFDEIFKLLKNNKPLNSLLKKYNQNGIKVIGEVLYNPLGKIEDDKISWVAIKYDKNKLGKIVTFVLFDVVDSFNLPLDNKNKIIEQIKKLSTNEILYADNKIIKGEIDIKFEITNFFKSINKDYNEMVRILKSRKKADKEEKALLKGIIDKYKKEISDKILKMYKSGKFGDEFEGLVLDLPSHRIKVINPIFKERHR